MSSLFALFGDAGKRDTQHFLYHLVDVILEYRKCGSEKYCTACGGAELRRGEDAGGEHELGAVHVERLPRERLRVAHLRRRLRLARFR